MKKIPLTKGKFAIVDDDDYEYLMQWKWCIVGTKYIYASRGQRYGKRSENKTKRILMHRQILKTPNGADTDHINGNTLDNRKENLRICNRSENNMNKRGNLRNKESLYKGVCKTRKNGKWCGTWRANIRFNNKQIHLGTFGSEKDAAIAYNHAAKKYFGEYALLNKVGG